MIQDPLSYHLEFLAHREMLQFKLFTLPLTSGIFILRLFKNNGEEEA